LFDSVNFGENIIPFGTAQGLELLTSDPFKMAKIYFAFALLFYALQTRHLQSMKMI
jgi:hypothetical protein